MKLCMNLFAPFAVCCHSEGELDVWSPPRLSIRTVCGDSSGDYLSCLIHSAGLQLGPLMHQKLTLSDYDVVSAVFVSLCAHINWSFQEKCAIHAHFSKPRNTKVL